jgi:O-6-methylguanine DNA methyltransferase
MAHQFFLTTSTPASFVYSSPLGNWQVQLTSAGVSSITLLASQTDYASYSHDTGLENANIILAEVATITQDEKTVLLAKTLLQKLDEYFQGCKPSFSEIPVQFDHLPVFSQRVLQHLRTIAHGETMTYQQLADKAGKPLAARAVGQVMKRNPVALILPCHRVVAATGALQGYFGSQPQGVALKQQLLQLEGSR